MPDPTVSILIAARNEETHILDCLQALDQLNFPKNQLDIWIGNDLSSDQTGPLVARFIADKPQFHLMAIPESTGPLRGKSHVLDQLAQQAMGQFLFFTDADVQVPPTWITDLLAQFMPTVGIVSGSTTVQGRSLIARLQAVDWLMAFTLVHEAAGWGIPVTAAGNNMAVRREAYEQVGGYASLPFSVTEDFALFRAVVRAGWKFRHRMAAPSLALTQPVTNLSDYLQQRKRWLAGAFQMPVYLIMLMLSQYLLLPLLGLVALVSPMWAVGIYGAKVGLQSLLLTRTLLQLRQYKLLPYVLPYELYQIIFGFLSVVYYLLPIPLRWKDRHYPL